MMTASQPHSLTMRQRSVGFSLVELSIVLVILGLLVGGVLSGQSLIKAAEMRQTLTFVTGFQSSWQTFRDKYQQIPGDLTNATAFWNRSPDAATNCTTQPGTAAAAGQGTCNGNGDGIVVYNSAHPSETILVNQHLRLAGLITAVQSGDKYNLPWSRGGVLVAPGIKTGVYAYVGGSGGFGAALYGDGTGVGGEIAQGNALQITGQHSTGYWYNTGPFPPEFAWNLDTKMDDGIPTSGNFFGMRGSDPADPGGAYLANCSTASGGSYVYNLSFTSDACRLMVMIK